MAARQDSGIAVDDRRNTDGMMCTEFSDGVRSLRNNGDMRQSVSRRRRRRLFSYSSNLRSIRSFVRSSRRGDGRSSNRTDGTKKSRVCDNLPRRYSILMRRTLLWLAGTDRATRRVPCRLSVRVSARELNEQSSTLCWRVSDACPPQCRLLRTDARVKCRQLGGYRVKPDGGEMAPRPDKESALFSSALRTCLGARAIQQSDCAFQR